MSSLDKCPECKDRGGFEGNQDDWSNCRTCGKGNAGWDYFQSVKADVYIEWDPIHYRTYSGQWDGKGKRCKCELCKSLQLKIINRIRHKKTNKKRKK